MTLIEQVDQLIFDRLQFQNEEHKAATLKAIVASGNLRATVAQLQAASGDNAGTLAIVQATANFAISIGGSFQDLPQARRDQLNADFRQLLDLPDDEVEVLTEQTFAGILDTTSALYELNVVVAGLPQAPPPPPPEG